jgi:nicotinamidase-related amidase
VTPVETAHHSAIPGHLALIAMTLNRSIKWDPAKEEILGDAEASKLLEIARDLKVPVIHIQHDGGAGTPYDIGAELGAIADEVAPIAGEPVITKNYPNAFVQTDLDERLKAIGIQKIMLAGFMTHMCINSTAHGGFNLGYAPTVVASTTATRALEGANGQVLSAQQVQDAAIASTRDLYAAIVDRVSVVGSPQG